MSSGGPEPWTAYAIPVPSAERANRMSCTPSAMDVTTR